ncbi:MAG: DUF86 domain-containing protein [Prevotellaceae bacterium]|jgi:uncharacterized protein with HEPN domain|nr:DUF86 domain-containing protein [Prevotellaceae bacterium]
MREQVRDKGRLEHILESIDYAFEFTHNVTFEEYQANNMMRFAVAKNLEIIGEASYKLTKEFCTKHADVEWQTIIKLRHVLVHGYYLLEDIVIWEIVQNDLPPLKQKIQQIYDTL